MNFRPKLADDVMGGTKTVTRRIATDNPRAVWFRGGCKIKPGRDYAVTPGRSKHAIGRVVVTSTTLEPLGHLDDAEAQREGFTSAAEFEKGFAEINGSYDPTVEVWRVELGEVIA